jgi:hypothetical protein
MNKTQLLSVTENQMYFLGKDTLIMKQEQVTWYSNDGTLVLGNGNSRGRQNCFLQPSQTGKSQHASF